MSRWQVLNPCRLAGRLLVAEMLFNESNAFITTFKMEARAWKIICQFMASKIV